MISLRKQIKLLAIVTSGLCVLVLGLLFRSATRDAASSSGWPQVSAGVLQAKKIVLMTDDGKPAAMMAVIDGTGALALLDKEGEARLLLSTANGSGYISLTGKNEAQSTYLKNGALTIGSESAGGVVIQAPPGGEPVVRVFDDSGYSMRIGRSAVANHLDGSVSLTSAAALTGSSKNATHTWSLLGQPASESTAVPEKAAEKHP